MDAMVSLRNDTQAMDDPLGLPCAWSILLTPLCLIPCESWFRVIPRHSTTWLDWFPYLRQYLDAARVKYRKGTYTVTIVTSVPWDMGTSSAFLAMLWVARAVASFEEIWNAVASSGLYSQTPSNFKRAMAGCIAIVSLATAVDWLVSFTFHEPITCSYNCVIEKGFSEGEKGIFPYLRRYLDTVLIPISQGTEVTIETEYDIFLWNPRPFWPCIDSNTTTTRPRKVVRTSLK